MNSSAPYPCSTRPSLTIIIPHLFFFVFFMMLSNLHAASVSLTWNANSESDLAGYKIYKRILSSTGYGSPVFSGLPSNPASPQITITNLLEGTSYGFIATAFDSSGNESVPSAEKQITTNTSSGSSGDGGSSSGGSGTFPPAMSSPAPGTTLTSNSLTFTGGHTSQDLEHWLNVGTSTGAKDLHNSGSMGTGHARTVSGLPTSGTIYVRYWTRNSSGWAKQDHSYTMAVGSGGSGGGDSSGGGSESFPPAMSSPAPSSTLTSNSVTFTGGHTSQDLEHWLEIGTSVGASNLYQSGTMGTSHTRTVSGLPTSGTIYVRYWTRNSSGWAKQDHSYTMAVGSGGSGSGDSSGGDSSGGGSESFPPAMSSPAPSSTLTSSSVTFTGGHTSQDTEHWLYVGTSTGAKDLHNSGSMGTSMTRTVSGLPTSGTIYVRYWTRNSSGWAKQDHTYTR